MRRLIGRRRGGKPAALLAVVIAICLCGAVPAWAAGDGTSGGCVGSLDPACTVGAGGGGGIAHGGGGDGGGSSVDLCAAYPGAAYGDQPPKVSQACADMLQGRYCAAMLGDMLGGLQWPAVGQLAIAQIDVVNQNLVRMGCPAMVTTATLAEQAFKTIIFPHPSGDRSPSQNQLYRGFPFTYIGLWTFYWTGMDSWTTLSATASAAGLTATVIAAPEQLVYDPGDGTSAVACAGPGRPWTDSDGNSAPSGGACGYQYGQVTSSPITSTQSIVWTITWTGTGGTGGEIPQIVTSTSGQLNVMQIQTVVVSR